MECLRCSNPVAPGKALCSECLSARKPKLTDRTLSLVARMARQRYFSKGVATLEYAGPLLRVLAFIIDLPLILCVQIITFKVINSFTHQNYFHKFLFGGFFNIDPGEALQQAMIGLFTYGFIPTSLYYAVCQGCFLHGTVGEIILRMQIKDLNGQQISVARSFVRTACLLGLFIPFVCLFSYAFYMRYQVGPIIMTLMQLSAFLMPALWLIGILNSQNQVSYDMGVGTIVLRKPNFSYERVMFGMVLACLIAFTLSIAAYHTYQIYAVELNQFGILSTK